MEMMESLQVPLDIENDDSLTEMEFSIKNNDNDLTDDWNMFVKVLLIAETIWNTRLMDKSAADIAKAEGLPKIYANYKRSKFTNIAPRLISFARGSGGLREFLTKKER